MIPVKTTGNQVNINGTSLMGYVKISYKNLVKAFGKPTSQKPSGDDKVRIRWSIEFEDGTVATIYDWKNYGKSVKWVKENYTEWHVGGKNQYAVDKVLDVLQEKQVEFSRLTFKNYLY